MSDNGAEGALLEALPVMGGSATVTEIINKYYNNEIDNMGMADSYIWYGQAWAFAATAPSRGFKTWITEGGIRCPCIVRYPPFGRPGSHTDSFATVMPSWTWRTCPCTGRSSAVGMSSPFAARRGFRTCQATLRAFTTRRRRRSLAGSCFRLSRDPSGPWKALYMTAPRGKDRWELYNVAQDPGELHDLAETEPEILQRLIRHWEVYYAETGMFDPGQEFNMVKYA